MEKHIYIYENWSSDEPQLLGHLYVNNTGAKETFSFEYDIKWLQAKNYLFIDPNLEYYEGRQYPQNDSKIFGIISDSCPDRWGRTLIERKELIQAKKEKRKPKKLTETDYLLAINDETRIGALRFSLSEDGPFESQSEGLEIPPIIDLRKLENASLAYELEEDPYEEKWFKQLIAPGSSLGGARPKSVVKNNDGSLWIAKFPSKNDTYDVGAWELLAYKLAKMCDINVADAETQKFSKNGSTFLTKRFDRNGTKRIHFASAMSLLNRSDGDKSTSYIDIADFIKAHGNNPTVDLKELWKRQIFNMAITNSDDHLRNHGFLLEDNKWNLSPAFDINPTPYGNTLSLNITTNDNSISLENAIKMSKYYNLNEDEANQLAHKIISIVNKNWETCAKNLKISNKEINLMRPAFHFSKQN